MRCALLASVAWCAMSVPAYSQFAVIDVQAAIQREFHQTQVLFEWGGQALSIGRQIAGDIQRFQQLRATYEALTRVTDLGSAVYALGLLGIRNPLPINPFALQGLLNGTGGTNGMLSNMGNLYTGTMTATRVVELPGIRWMERQINANGGGIAGVQAVALQLYESAAQRVPLIEELQARINTASDPSEREALIARLAAEQAYIQNQHVQMQSVAAFAAGQYQIREQQREEVLMNSINQMHASAQARGAIR